MPELIQFINRSIKPAWRWVWPGDSCSLPFRWSCTCWLSVFECWGWKQHLWSSILQRCSSGFPFFSAPQFVQTIISLLYSVLISRKTGSKSAYRESFKQEWSWWEPGNMSGFCCLHEANRCEFSDTWGDYVHHRFSDIIIRKFCSGHGMFCNPPREWVRSLAAALLSDPSMPDDIHGTWRVFFFLVTRIWRVKDG